MRRVIFEPDAKFNAEVVATVEDYGIRPIRIAFRSPWQNGIGERWVGSVRRDLLDHVIVLNQRHLRRLIKITSATITKIGLTSDSVRTLPAVELRPLHPRAEAKSFPCRDSVDSITATLQRPESAAG